MTVSTELSHEEYVGNGVTTDFDFRFRIFEGKHLIVVVADSDGIETTLKNGTDYTIVGAGSYHGGKVVLNKPLARGWKILLERDLPVVQETDLRNQGKFFAEVHEDAFDYLTMLIQKALGTFSLSLRKPTYLSNYYDAKGNRIANLAPPKFGSDSANKDYVDNSIKDIDSKTLRVKDKPINALPNTEQRANKILAFDDNGQPITVLPESGSASDVLIELEKQTGSSFIGYKYPTKNSTKRTVNKKLDDSVSILDFGVVGDGVHDDTYALMEVLEYCYENKVGINGVSGLRSKITDTIYLPLFEDRMKLIDLDFDGLILLPTDDVGDVFISGKKDNGRWVSCMDDPVMAQNVSNLYVRNLVINNNNVDNAIGRRAFGFKELHINCKTDNLVARNFGLGFDFNNCFYLHSNNNVLLNSEALLSQESIGHKYRNACNLIKIESPIALNTRNGYLFEHGVTGLVMDKASFEAQGVSIVSNGEIFDMTVKDSYLENVGDDRDVCFDFRSYSHVTFSNNYMLPKRAKHLFKHKPFQPRNMIEVQRNNHIIGIDPENYFINKGLSYSVIDLKNTQANASLSNTLYRMSEIGEGVIINKKAMNINAGGRITHISNVVNEYIPGNYSGKYNSGYTYGALHGLYNPIKDIEKGTCSFNTQILYSDMQLLLLNLRIADTNETKEYIGTIWGNTCRKPDGTIDSRVQVINDNGKVSLIISGIKVGNFNIVGGELRVI
ncbi:hypothetical protein KMU_14110 [Proteus vulgaris]|uniref:hypothetical protein n=3 Tax=Gammaproteobacteria TaxID=1236 RepID=UPI002554A257|nr:hypothetical protein [Proteus vulgaris]GLX63370.1 hypothetical protein KMU_14110 [Proteus vulgaris]